MLENHLIYMNSVLLCNYFIDYIKLKLKNCIVLEPLYKVLMITSFLFGTLSLTTTLQVISVNPFMVVLIDLYSLLSQLGESSSIVAQALFSNIALLSK